MSGRLDHQAIRRFLDYLAKPELLPEEAEWMLAQWNTPQLREGVWALGAAVFPDALCRACEAMLPEYVHRQVMHEDAASRYPQVKAHLEACANCAQAYEELLEMMSLVYAGEIPPAPAYPSFDLSFLSRSAASERPGVWQSVLRDGKQIIQLVTRIPVLIKQGLASFGTLPPPLMATPLPSLATREKAEAGKAAAQGQTLTVLRPEDDLSITLTIGPASEAEAYLSVLITQISSQKPFKQVRVNIRDQDHRLLVSDMTQADGRAAFSHLGATCDVIEIRFQGRTLEMPVRVESGEWRVESGR